MFHDAKQVGHFRLIACSAGLEYMGVDGKAVEAKVDEVLGIACYFESDRRGGDRSSSSECRDV